MDKLNSYFGEGTSMKGSLKFKGLLRFDGRFTGDISTSDTFIVGAPGKVEANVKTGTLYNFGVIVGDVDAQNKVSLHAKSSLEGNLSTPVLMTEELAFFQGSCTMPISRREELVSGSKGKEIPGELKPADMDQITDISSGGARSGGLGKIAVLLLLAVIFAGAWFVLKPGLNLMNATDVEKATPHAAKDTGQQPVQRKDMVTKLREEGSSAFADGNYELAAKKLEEVVKLSGADDETLKMLGAASARSNNRSRAIEIYEKLGKTRDDLEVLGELADLYQSGGDSEKLISTLKKMSLLAPDDRKIKSRLENLTATSSAPPDPVEEIKAQIKKDRSNPKLRIKLANLLIKRREYVKSIKLLEKALKDFPSNTDVRLLLARTLHRTGREKDALVHFNFMAKRDPGFIEARNNLAFQQLNKGALNDAAANFRLSLTEDADNHRARLGLAMVFSKLEQNKKASEECIKILNKVSDYAPAKNRLAWIYAKQSVNLNKAEKLSKESLLIFPDIPEYIDTLSEINFRKGNYDEAVKLIKRAVKLVPNDSYYKRQLFKFQRARKHKG